MFWDHRSVTSCTSPAAGKADPVRCVASPNEAADSPGAAAAHYPTSRTAASCRGGAGWWVAAGRCRYRSCPLCVHLGRVFLSNREQVTADTPPAVVGERLALGQPEGRGWQRLEAFVCIAQELSTGHSRFHCSLAGGKGCRLRCRHELRILRAEMAAARQSLPAVTELVSHGR